MAQTLEPIEYVKPLKELNGKIDDISSLFNNIEILLENTNIVGQNIDEINYHLSLDDKKILKNTMIRLDRLTIWLSHCLTQENMVGGPDNTKTLDGFIYKVYKVDSTKSINQINYEVDSFICVYCEYGNKLKTIYIVPKNLTWEIQYDFNNLKSIDDLQWTNYLLQIMNTNNMGLSFYLAYYFQNFKSIINRLTTYLEVIKTTHVCDFDKTFYEVVNNEFEEIHDMLKIIHSHYFQSFEQRFEFNNYNILIVFYANTHIIKDRCTIQIKNKNNNILFYSTNCPDSLYNHFVNGHFEESELLNYIQYNTHPYL